MSREGQRDYENLESFISSYSLSTSISNDDFKLNLTKQHKRYYALIVFAAELNHQNFDPIDPASENHDILIYNFNNYIPESISEMGSALFVWLHGCYKICQQTLRSSIENYLKGIGSIEFDDITGKKNTYEVFDLVSSLPFFLENPNRHLFDSLKSHYSDLCASVHTATFQNMQNISSLGYFPHFKKENADIVASKFISIAEDFLSILCLMFPDTLKNMHYKNQDIIMPILDRETRHRLKEI